MARRLAAAGHRIVGPEERAQLCILNTCTVTSIASKKSRQLIRQNPSVSRQPSTGSASSQSPRACLIRQPRTGSQLRAQIARATQGRI